MNQDDTDWAIYFKSYYDDVQRAKKARERQIYYYLLVIFAALIWSSLG